MESNGTGSYCPNFCPVEIVLETVMERHLREELRIANYHLQKAREELRKMRADAPPSSESTTPDGGKGEL